VEILGTDRVEGVRIVHNELVEDEGRVSARPTGESEVIEAQMVVRSVGYTGSPLPGVPFDVTRGTIHNHCGRVTHVGTEDPLPGVYTAGWVKRGPSGVIGTNKKCAQETVDLLLEDLEAGKLPEPTSTPNALLEALEERGVEVVDYAGWELIDAHEKSLGEPHGRPRVKLVRRAEHLLHAAASKVRS
jgi:ferredoxin--NADP+ reductase